MLTRATSIFKTTSLGNKRTCVPSSNASLNNKVAQTGNIVSTIHNLFGQSSLLQKRSFHISAMLLAVPKKRQSHSRSRLRRHGTSNQLLKKHFTHYAKCKHCGKTTVRHNVCVHCGWYKGQPVTLKARRKEAKIQSNAQETTSEAQISESQTI